MFFNGSAKNSKVVVGSSDECFGGFLKNYKIKVFLLNPEKQFVTTLRMRQGFVLL